MIVCLDCRAAWPSGSTFCGQCGRTFGGKRCKNQHLNPKSVQYCLKCGNAEMSDMARSVNLKLAVTIIAFFGVLLCFRTVLSQFWLVLQMSFGVLNTVLGIATGHSLNGVVAFLITLFIFTAIPVLFIDLILSRFPGKPRLLPLYLRMWRLVGIYSGKLILAVLRQVTDIKSKTRKGEDRKKGLPR